VTGYLLAAALGATLAAVVLIARALRRSIAVVTVRGPSMRPTLNPGERVLVRRVGIGELRAGQIVVIDGPRDATLGKPRRRWPPTPRGWMIKRVAAMPGEPTPAVMLGAPGLVTPVVPTGRIVVLGDNPARSLDSRHIGYIPADQILAVMIRSLPGR
jgi:signal peptidase I